MRFFLGTHMPHWLADERFRDVPLFVSRRTLAGRKTLPRALGLWAADGGGFTELQLHGRWTVTPREYVAEVRRFRDEIGGMLWAAPQDWMCEPVVIAGGRMNGVTFKGTGLSVEEHQRRTVDNFRELRSLGLDEAIPVLQGFSLVDYWRCEDMYGRVGINLRREPIVGVGTVCRRQGTTEAVRIMTSLAASGLSLHGFGFKVLGLRSCAGSLVSADSLAWSFAARRDPPIPGHDQPGPGRRTGHVNCANCAEYALGWRASMLSGLAERDERRSASAQGHINMEQLPLFA